MNAFLPHRSKLRLSVAVIDCGILIVAGWLAHVLRFSAGDRELKLAELARHPGLVLLAFAVLSAFAVAAELYEPLVLRRRREVGVRVLAVAVAWGTSLALSTYLVPEWRFGRGLLLLTMLVFFVGATAARAAVARWAAHRPRPRALVVGEPAAVEEVCSTLARHPFSPWDAVPGSEVPAAGVAQEAARCGAELVVLAGREGGANGLAADLATLHFSGLPVVVSSEIWAWVDGRLPLSELSPAMFLHQPGFGAIHWELFNRLTRVLDLVLGTVLCLLALPFLLVAALAVLLLDGRPVLYRQQRVGQFGRRFEVLKLRTMPPDAERSGPRFAEHDDPRSTPVGKVLRRLRVDELPQLLNVLKGEMSLVGPRPERPEFIGNLAAGIPYYTFRLAVPPGLTGWAQVNMPYARTPEEHALRLEYDLYFIRERSVGLYLLTLLRTANAALVGVRR